MKLLSLNVNVEKIVKQALGTKNFSSAGLISHWSDIVGQEEAQHCLPLSLRFPKGEQKEGTLTVKCRASYALELQHRQIEFLSRINAYFGYKAIARLKIQQGQIFAKKKRAVSLPVLSEKDVKALENELSEIPESTLRERLSRFGKVILQRKKLRQLY